MRGAGATQLRDHDGQRRGAYGDGDFSDSSWTEEQRPESTEQPVAHRQVWRPQTGTPQGDQLLLEQEILRDRRSHAFDHASVHRKYRRLFSSSQCRKTPGPKGPSDALIQAIVDLKSRNPRFG